MAVELKVNYREKYYFKDVHSSVDDEYKIDFNKGIWAAFENGEAEAYDLSKLENITELEPLTHMYEFNFPSKWNSLYNALNERTLASSTNLTLSAC